MVACNEYVFIFTKSNLDDILVDPHFYGNETDQWEDYQKINYHYDKYFIILINNLNNW